MKNQKPNKKRYLIRDIIIKPRVPKWERRALEKKEVEEYFAIHKSELHPLVKKYHKSKHFLKWSIKLLVPDFLIGHPNLWDNLKTLRKHPQFKPLRMALVAWMIFSITTGGLGIYSLKYAVKTFAASPVTDTFTDTTKIATSTQITVDTGAGQVKLSVIPWTCGETLTDSRDSKTYNTVLIGSQCWMAESLNYGTLTAGANEQGSDCPSVAATEKYCYDDTESKCTSDGAFYQWDQAMCGAASCNGTGAPPNDACATPIRGICPSGWHIPSHYEYTTLEKNLGLNPNAFPYDETTTGWLGTDEGTQLKVGGSSDWEGLLTGDRSTNGSFNSRDSWGGVWSSLGNGSVAWKRALGLSKTTLYREAVDKLYGFSIRCLKD